MAADLHHGGFIPEHHHQHGSISGHSAYRILSAVVPLYIAIGAGYCSVKFKLLTPADIAGINRFVVLIAIPVLSFRFIAEINLYEISYRVILADTLFKLLVLGALAAYALAQRQVADLDWLIMLWMVTTLSNTLIVGVPTLVAMYGPMAKDLIGQVVVGQAVIWYPGLMLLYELRASCKEEKRRTEESLEATDGESELGTEVGGAEQQGRNNSDDERALESLAEHGVASFQALDVESSQETLPEVTSGKPNGVANGLHCCNGQVIPLVEQQVDQEPERQTAREPASDIRIRVEKHACNKDPVQASNSTDIPSKFETSNLETSDSKLELQRLTSSERSPPKETQAPKAKPVLRGQLSLVVRNGGVMKRGSSRRDQAGKWKRTLRILGWKLRKSFTVHAAVLGLIYSLVAYRSGFGLPLIVRKSLDVLADTGVGTTMFSLGMFMGSTAVFPCGFCLSLAVHGLHFLVGPTIMGAISLALGLRGDTLRIAIIQAALPQAIVSFSFAKEYDAYPEVLSTSITFGTLISLPVALVYYVIMGQI